MLLQDIRKQAEENIKHASKQPGFALAVLQVKYSQLLSSSLVSYYYYHSEFEGCHVDQLHCVPILTVVGTILKVVATESPIEIRQAAAVNFKNHVKYNWVSLLSHASLNATAASMDALISCQSYVSAYVAHATVITAGTFRSGQAACCRCREGTDA